MSRKLSTTTIIVAALLIAASPWQPLRADDNSTKQSDEARLILLQEELAATASKLADLIRQSLASGGTDQGKPREDSPASPTEKQGGAEQDEADVQISEAERSLFNIVNAYRKKQGLEPLQLDASLCRAARDHSSDMNKHSFFSHQSPVPGRTRFTDRASNHDATASAENIAKDCKDAKMAMSLWVNSQHHRENLTGSHTRIGVGVDEKGLYTQVFGK